MRVIDLRSDTLTKPSSAMRQAMAEAAVGDDDYGEDPSVRALEETVAALLRKETALFVPSGTMSNQIALALHTKPGDIALVGQKAHVGLYEAGAPSALSGVQLDAIPGDGRFTPEALEETLRDAAFYQSPQTLLAVENTHNQGGGLVWEPEALDAVGALALERGLHTHMDGARIWNAAITSGASEAELARNYETVSVCFSKGLGAPVGSALLMPQALRQEALRLRRRFGGAMRQSGVIAKGALFALTHHRGDLARDHEGARRLAEGIQEAGGLVTPPMSNIVAFDLPGSYPEDGKAFCSVVARGGVFVSAIGRRRIRAVTHRDLWVGEGAQESEEDVIDRAIAAIARALHA